MYTVLLYWCHTQTEYSLYVYTAAGLDIERRRVRLNSSDRNAEALLHFNQKYPEEEERDARKGKLKFNSIGEKLVCWFVYITGMAKLPEWGGKSIESAVG